MSTSTDTAETFRRIVTGHDEDGRAVILSDAPPPRVHQIGGPRWPDVLRSVEHARDAGRD